MSSATHPATATASTAAVVGADATPASIASRPLDASVASAHDTTGSAEGPEDGRDCSADPNDAVRSPDVPWPFVRHKDPSQGTAEIVVDPRISNVTTLVPATKLLKRFQSWEQAKVGAVARHTHA